MLIPIRRLHCQAVLPTQTYEHDAGFDLHAVEPAVLAPGERAIVGTGFALELPAGHAGLILPRSGLAANHGISVVNAPGLIDAGYRGEVRVLLLNTDLKETFPIDVGDRIAQLVITALPTVTFTETQTLATSDRKERGFGSSGVKATTCP